LHVKQAMRSTDELLSLPWWHDSNAVPKRPLKTLKRYLRMWIGGVASVNASVLSP
jgi:hypothetical protein